MTEAAKPTPVPYAIGKNGFENYVITNGLDKIIASLNPMGSLLEEESKATAEFIVRACNSYADMAAALVELVSTVEMYRENVYRRGNGTASNECVNMLSANTLAARAALAKASAQ